MTFATRLALTGTTEWTPRTFAQLAMPLVLNASRQPTILALPARKTSFCSTAPQPARIPAQMANMRTALPGNACPATPTARPVTPRLRTARLASWSTDSMYTSIRTSASRSALKASMKTQAVKPASLVLKGVLHATGLP